MGPWCPHDPTERQVVALEKHAIPDVLYGGAVAGGKSDWLLMEALRGVHVPGYSALLLRRTFKRLGGASGLIERLGSWLVGTPAQYHKGENVWRFPSGATIRFGHLERLGDERQYNSHEYQMIGFDELTEFAESQAIYLWSRLRQVHGVTVPLRIRSASNPGGEGHDWVRRRYMVERHPDRAFVPAKLRDNPYVRADEYRRNLAHLHPFERQQLEEGDWEARPPGSRFRREWFRMRENAPTGGKLVRAWDLAATEPRKGADPDYTVGTLMRFHEGRISIEDVQRFRGTPGTVDARILQTAHLDGPGVHIWIEQEGGSSGKIAAEHFRKLLAGYPCRSQPATGKKEVRANPFASYAEGGLVDVLVRDWTEELLRELERFPEGHDDQVDTCSLGFSKLVQPGGATPSGMYGDHLYPEEVAA